METHPIAIGSHVELNLVDRTGKKDLLVVDIVADEAADFSHGFLGAGTQLAKTILGEKAGSVIPYLKDDVYAIEILSVTAATAKPPEDAQKKRQARLKEAMREVEHTSAVMFASSFSGKWGDYDPDSLPKDTEPDEDKLESD